MKSMARKAKRNFHMVQNMIYQQPVSSHAKILYAALCYLADNKTGECFPGKKKLAELCGIGVTSVYKGLKELEAIGLIKIEPQFINDGQTTNLYTVFDYPGEAFEIMPENTGLKDQTNVSPHSQIVTPPFTNCHPPIHKLSPPHSPSECKQYLYNKNLSNKRGGATPPCGEAAPPPPQKVVYGQMFEQVQLHHWEYDGLVQILGSEETAEYINRLDSHIASTGKKYASHYATIYKWFQEDNRKAAVESNKQHQPKRNFHNFTERSTSDNVDMEEMARKEREYVMHRLQEED